MKTPVFGVGPAPLYSATVEAARGGGIFGFFGVPGFFGDFCVFDFYRLIKIIISKNRSFKYFTELNSVKLVL